LQQVPTGSYRSYSLRTKVKGGSDGSSLAKAA